MVFGAFQLPSTSYFTADSQLVEKELIMYGLYSGKIMKCVKCEREAGFYAFSKAEHITLQHDLHTNE